MPDVILRNLDGPFDALPRRYNNGTYSMQEIAVLLYLVNRPDGWKMNFADLVKQFDNGKAAVRTACDRLKKKGHLRIEKIQGERGTMMGWEWTISTEIRFSDFGGEAGDTRPNEVVAQVLPKSDYPTSGNRTHKKKEGKKKEGLPTDAPHPTAPNMNEFAAAIREHLYQPDGQPPRGHNIGRCLSVVKQMIAKGVSEADILDAICGVRLMHKNKAYGREIEWLSHGKLTMLAFNRAEQQGVRLLEAAAHEYRKQVAA